MKESLRTLLSAAIDYAGFFPPAKLSLAESISRYRGYQRSADAWMLGSCVTPITHLEEVVNLAHESTPFAVVGRGTASLPADRELVREYQGRLNIRAFETKLGNFPPLIDLLDEIRLFEDESIQVFIEVPDFSVVPDPWPYRLKLRTGGLEASAFPSVDHVAAFIHTCARRKIFWKATAGLHHPFRKFRPEVDTHMHGFINLLTAVVLAEAHGVGTDILREVLADETPEHFHFNNDELRWGEWPVTVDQIARSRFAGFGSCSFDEPRDDLRELGLW